MVLPLVHISCLLHWRRCQQANHVSEYSFCILPVRTLQRPDCYCSGSVPYRSLAFWFATDCSALASLLPYFLPNLMAMGSHCASTASTALAGGMFILLRTGPF